MAECAAFAFADWMSTLGALADAESCMLAVLDELGLTGLVTTVPGLSAVGEETEQSALRPVVGPD